MELKEGYKQTEVGVIPEDWEVKPLREGLSETPAYGINAPAQTYKKGLPAYIRITDITDEGTYNPPKQTYVDVSDEKQYFLKQGDIVFARTGASVGKSYLYHKSDGELVYAGFLIKVHPDSITFYPEYVFYFAHSAQYWNWVAKTSMRSGQPGINGVEYGELLLPCPRINEQKAIVSVLSDVDALLSSLNALIAKKRDMKKAAMQELLTGKTRLPCFKGYWETKKIGEILEVCHGKGQSEVESSTGTIPILASGGQIGTASEALYSEPSVLIGRKGTIDKPQYVDIPFWTIDTLFYTKIYPNNVPLFIFYIFCLIDWKQYNEASGVPSLNANTIENIEISLPQCDEQTAIAAVLSDMDAEIAALEARRAKMQDIKTGMMQELLTGKTRLLPKGKQHG